jgi:hypothetical protein
LLNSFFDSDEKIGTPCRAATSMGTPGV